MTQKLHGSLGLAVLLAGLALPAAAASPAKSNWGEGADDKAFARMVETGFKANGIATLDRLRQDETQRLCSDPVAATGKAAAARRQAIEEANLAAVKWPTDGVWLGNWKEGEKIAQSGRGLTWTDKAGSENGGNCYNCHQITAEEISHGTIGPSLYNYGKLKGFTYETLRYTWGKIYNGKASNACSNMPRGGHMGIITEQQIRHLMSLLLDPQSPVNK